MSEFQRRSTKFIHKGMNWNRSVDTIPDGQVTFARNIRVNKEGEVTGRPGLTVFATLAGAPAWAHSMSRLNNYTALFPNGYVYVMGADQDIFVGQTSAQLMNAAINPIKLPPGGAFATLSGNPLSMVDAATAGGATYWKYVSDSTQMLAVGYYPGDTPGTNMARAITMGLQPPSWFPVLTVNGGGMLTGSYQWAAVFRRNFTGAKSNPSALTRNTLATPAVALAANSVTFTLPTAPIDPLTGAPDLNISVDVYRFGGTVLRYAYVGTAAAGTSFTDNLPDLQILAAPAPSQVIDSNGITRFNLYQPFPISMAAQYSTTNGTVSQAANNVWLLTAGGADTFPTGIVQGSIIGINNAIFHVYQVRSATVIELAEDPTGTLVAGNTYPWVLPTGTIVMGKPCPHIWGPYGLGEFGSVIFGCGAAGAVGTLFWCNGNDPDSSDIANSLVVTSPSEPLRGGCVYNGVSYVWSTERMFQILPSLSAAGQFYVQEVPGGKGLWMEYSLTVQTNSIADQSISWVGKDGIYNFTPGSGVQSLTDKDLFPFFPHDNIRGLNLGQIHSSVTEAVFAPDFNQGTGAIVILEKYHRLAWIDGELFYDYPTVSANVYGSLVFDAKQAGGWVSLDLYGGVNTLPISRMVEVAGNNMKIALGGSIYDYGTMIGTLATDAGVGIAARIVTRADDAGDLRAQKLYGDLFFDANPNSLTVSIKVLTALNTVLQITPTVNQASRTSGYLEVAANGLGFLGQTLGLDISWTGSGAILYQWQYSFVPKPEVQGLRPLDKTDDGWLGAKYLRGFVIECNTFNQARKINVLVDNVGAINPLTGNGIYTVNSGTNTQVELPFGTIAIGQEFQISIDASDVSTVGWEIWAVRWIWEKWPELDQRPSAILNLRTDRIKEIRSLVLPLDTNGVAVTFTVLFDSGASVASYVLPATTTAPSKKTPTAFVFDPPVIAHTLQFIPNAPCRAWYDEIPVVAEEWPELAREFSAWISPAGRAKPAYVRGFSLPVETGGATVAFVVRRDSNATVSVGSATTTALIKTTTAFVFATPVISHDLRIEPAAGVRCWWSEIVWDAEEYPELTSEFSPVLYLGSDRIKYIRGFVLPVDTGNLAVSCTAVFDGLASVASYVLPSTTTAAGVKSPIPFAFDPPILTHTVQFQPGSAWRAWWNEIAWDYEEWPEFIPEYSNWIAPVGKAKPAYFRGFSMPIDTGGVSVTFTGRMDNGTTVALGSFTTTINLKTVCAFTPTPPPPVTHVLRIEVSGPCRCWYTEIVWEAEEYPELSDGYSEIVNCGYARAKFMQGCVVPLDTNGVAIAFEFVNIDTGLAGYTSPPVIANGKQSLAFSWPPFIAHLIQIIPIGDARVFMQEASWVWEPSPELALTWQTPQMTHGLSGWLHQRLAWMAYLGTAIISFTRKFSDGTSETYILPASNTFTKLLLPLSPKKSLWFEYGAVSAAPFQLFMGDMEFHTKQWGESGAYSVQKPIGSASVVQGADI